jgi:hypothetical protein
LDDPVLFPYAVKTEFHTPTVIQWNVIVLLAATESAVSADSALMLSPDEGKTFIALTAAAFTTVISMPGFALGSFTESAAVATVVTRLFR